MAKLPKVFGSAYQYLYLPVMESHITDEFITCGACRLSFERSKEYKHCSNCFACTGCEIYYCPGCDHEIVITPVKPSRKKE